MSMIRLAASPGTAVLPTCSIAAAIPASKPKRRERSVSKTRGHDGS